MPEKPSAKGFLLRLIGSGMKEAIKGAAGLAVAGLGPVGVGVAWGMNAAIDCFGPPIGMKVMAWLRITPPADAAEALAEMADLSPDEVRRLARAIINEVAPPEATAHDKDVASYYLAAVPAALRASMARDARTGKSVCPPNLVPRSEEEVVRLLPVGVPPFPTPFDLPNTDYRLTDLLGTGGFGAVYHAVNRNEQYGDPRAIKFCLDAKAAVSLRRERDVLDRLVAAGRQQWPAGIVRLYGHRLDAQPPYLVYECVAGGDLGSYVARRTAGTGRGLPPDEALRVVRAITEALAAAHARGLVHRDLKPSNVLLADDSLSSIELADFGIGAAVGPAAGPRHATAREQSLLLRGSGTPLYMSDEQSRGDPPDPRHDVYSLGVVWFQLLTGDLRRAVGPAWREELLEDFRTPQVWVDLIGLCIGRLKNRPTDAMTLKGCLTSPSVPTALLSPPSCELEHHDLFASRLTNPLPAADVIVSSRGEGQYATIGEALKIIQINAVVHVRPGIYKESVIITKSVTLCGDGPVSDIVIESTESSCILMEADHATVRGLTLRGRAGTKRGSFYGVDIAQGQLILEDCIITSDSLSCVAIRGPSTNPLIRRCNIHGGYSAGIFVHEHGRGIVEDCTITGNRKSGVDVYMGGAPIIRRCKIHAGKSSGILVRKQGKGVVEDCDITSSILAGIAISQGGDPIIRRCKIHDGKSAGVFVFEQGKGNFEDCDIFGNQTAGVSIIEGSDPIIRRCKINRNAYQAVRVNKHGKGTVEGCDLTGNTQGAWEIEAGCEVRQGENLE